MKRSSKTTQTKGNFINSNVNTNEAFKSKILRLRHDLVESHGHNALRIKKSLSKTKCTVQTKPVYNTCMSQHSKDLFNSTSDIFYAKKNFLCLCCLVLLHFVSITTTHLSSLFQPFSQQEI